MSLYASFVHSLGRLLDFPRPDKTLEMPSRAGVAHPERLDACRLAVMIQRGPHPCAGFYSVEAANVGPGHSYTTDHQMQHG